MRTRTRACAWAAVWAALALLVLPAAANVRLDLGDLPPENRVGGFSSTSEIGAGQNIAFVQYPCPENGPILAMTASGRLFWLSRDPLGEFADPLHNLYRFCENDPVNRIDPDGRNPILIVAAILLLSGAEYAVAPEDESDATDPSYQAGQGVMDMMTTAAVMGGTGVALGKAGQYLRLGRGELFRLRVGARQMHVGRHPLPMSELNRWYSRSTAGRLRPTSLSHFGYQTGAGRTWHYPFWQWRTAVVGGGLYGGYELLDYLMDDYDVAGEKSDDCK